MKGNVLISGLGVAGPALAYWLLREGLTPTIVEHAPQPRTGGYIIDFWGLGYDIVEKMGLLPEVLAAGYKVREVRIVDDRGRRSGGFDAELFRAATLGRYTSLPRGDLSAILTRAIEGRAELRFGDSIESLEERADGVGVRFRRAPPGVFDMVIGADGLHSRVRALHFGPESQFERFLGYVVAAFEVTGYRPRDEDVYVAYSIPGRQVARFAMRGDRTMFLCVIADSEGPPADTGDPGLDKRYLTEHLRGLGWETPPILTAIERCDDVYFDRVSQIRMPGWSTSRVALVGDAAYAPSLLAGQGAALAVIGAYVLAGELARADRPQEAFARYEALLGPFMRGKQRAAERFASSFAPRTRLGVFVRNQVTRALALPYVAKLAMGKGLLDRIRLPAYA